jgi:hypothetical protein
MAQKEKSIYGSRDRFLRAAEFQSRWEEHAGGAARQDNRVSPHSPQKISLMDTGLQHFLA